MKKLEAFGRPIDNFYMDCNSLIYDAVRDMGNRGPSAGIVDSRLIATVCAKIHARVGSVRPTSRLMIAFDGVAPVAKLAQQRNRRYKSWFQKRVAELVERKPKGWDTAAITPGTSFMAALSSKVRSEFANYESLEVVVSPPDEPGEGEHKIYEYIRENPEAHADSCTVIYGLDADLIMLTLNHLHVAPDMHLLREAPEFARSLDASLDPDSSYLLDIPAFGDALSLDLRPQRAGGGSSQRMAVSDYIFLCFFLGNDFLPHFPALNIRSQGIDRLMAAYSSTIGSTKSALVGGDTINWTPVRRLVQHLASNEHSFILEEYKLRDKQARRAWAVQKSVEGELNALPMRDRGLEMYINPRMDGWEARYYQSLFEMEPDEERIKEVCMNYLEGLEWTLQYYTSGCPDWRWTYKYDYPPLLVDLARYVPGLSTRLVERKPKDPVNSLVQLSYVLPSPSLDLLPKRLKHVLLLSHAEWYEPEGEMLTAFCRYIWEAHPRLNPIDISELEAMVSEWKRTKDQPSLLGI